MIILVAFCGSSLASSVHSSNWRDQECQSLLLFDCPLYIIPPVLPDNVSSVSSSSLLLIKNEGPLLLPLWLDCCSSDSAHESRISKSLLIILAASVALSHSTISCSFGPTFYIFDSWTANGIETVLVKSAWHFSLLKNLCNAFPPIKNFTWHTLLEIFWWWHFKNTSFH